LHAYVVITLSENRILLHWRNPASPGQQPFTGVSWRCLRWLRTAEDDKGSWESKRLESYFTKFCKII